MKFTCGVFLLGAGVAAAADLNFVSVGDWGDTGASKINDLMASYDPEWVLAIGDNFYNSGVTGTDDPLFKKIFEDQFTQPELDVPWYLCAGNHDYYGGTESVAAEIAYTQKSDRWTFPSLYFDKVIKGDDGTTVHFFSVDTWRIIGGNTLVTFDPLTSTGEIRNKTDLERRVKEGIITEETYNLVRSGYNHTTEGTAPLKASPDQEQLDWLDSRLKASTADWKIVFGHYPIYSSTTGEHGDTAHLIEWLLPVLKENKVDAYFNGHDHILQHIYKDDIHFIGSGAGARTHTGVNESYTGLMGYHEGHYGFMSHNISKTEFSIIFVDDTGAMPYNFTIKK